MKSLLSIIRWKFVIPTAIFIAGVVVFLVIFMDPLLAKAMEALGGKVNGAKVEVSGLRTKIFKGRLDISRLQVTNKNQPLENIVEGGPLAFQLSLGDLFTKRVLINQASLEGLKFNTARKTSGALPKQEKKADEKPGLASRLADKYKDKFVVNLQGIKSDAKGKIEFDKKDLQIVKQSDALKLKAEAAPDQWKGKVEGLRVEDRLKEVEKKLKEIRETKVERVEALTAVPESLKKLKAAKEDLNKIKADVQSTRTELTSELKNYKAGVLKLTDAKNQDINGLLSRLNLDFADPERLVQGMIGPAVLSRFQTAMKYVEIARSHMPSAKEKASLPEKPRAEGMDIEFPTPVAPPRFWLIKGLLSGTYQDLNAKGEMTHLTSDPSRVGKPFKLVMKGDKGPQNFSLVGLFDHVGDISKDSLSAEVSGLDARGVIKEGFLGESLASGSGRAEIFLSLVGEKNIGGHIRLFLKGLKFDDRALLSQAGIQAGTQLSRQDDFKAGFLKSLARSMEKMPEVSINTQLAGTWDNPDLKITSNLTSVFSGVIKDSIGSAVKEQRAKLEAELNQVLNEKRAEVESKLAGLEDQLNKQLGGLDNQVQEKINQASGLNLTPKGGGEGGAIPGIKIPSFDKLFKK